MRALNALFAAALLAVSTGAVAQSAATPAETPPPDIVAQPEPPPGFTARKSTPAPAANPDAEQQRDPPAPRFVERGWFGGCPAGYVDHPSNPKLCALPYVAERMMQGVRRRRR